jgi:hypothetical protein
MMGCLLVRGLQSDGPGSGRVRPSAQRWLALTLRLGLSAVTSAVAACLPFYYCGPPPRLVRRISKRWRLWCEDVRTRRVIPSGYESLMPALEGLGQPRRGLPFDRLPVARGTVFISAFRTEKFIFRSSRVEFRSSIQLRIG